MKKRIGIFILGFVLMAIGGSLFYLESYSVLVNGFKSKNWPTVSALVKQNWVNTRAGEDQDLHHLIFEATYSVNGKEYSKAYRYLGSEGSTLWKSDYFEFADDHPAGSNILLYYNPEKPYEATVKPGILSNFNFLIIFCCSFFLGGLLFFIGGLRSKNYKKDPEITFTGQY